MCQYVDDMCIAHYMYRFQTIGMYNYDAHENKTSLGAFTIYTTR